MGAVIAYTLIGLLCALFVQHFLGSLRQLGIPTPRWLFAAVVFGVVLAFLLVPQQSEPIVGLFRAAHH